MVENYRVWDAIEKRYIDLFSCGTHLLTTVVLDCFGHLYMINKAIGDLSNFFTIDVMSRSRYVVQRNTGTVDSNGKFIYEGDCLSDGKIIGNILSG